MSCGMYDRCARIFDRNRKPQGFGGGKTVKIELILTEASVAYAIKKGPLRGLICDEHASIGNGVFAWL